MEKKKPYICTIKDEKEIRYAQDALYVLSGKWRMPVVLALHNGLRRYREIAQSIPGITFAMLSKELQVMELNNLVERIEDPDFPIPENLFPLLTMKCLLLQYFLPGV